jgi:hypothetical protein
MPPLEGYFRLYQGSPSYAALTTLEGTDPYGIPSSRATDHYLQFMIDASADENARRDRKENWFSANVGLGSPLADQTNNAKYGWYPAGFYDANNPTMFYSQQAEVSWHLRQLLTAGGIPRFANGIPLYSLYRRQLLVVPNNSGVNNASPAQPRTNVYASQQNPIALDGNGQQQDPLSGNPSSQLLWSFYVGSPWTQPPGGRQYMLPFYTGISCKPDTRPNMTQYVYFNSPKDLTMPVRRFGMVPLQGQSPPPPPPGQQAQAQPFEMAGMLSNGTYPNPGYWLKVPNQGLTPVYPTYAEDGPPSNGQMQGLAGEDLVLTNVISFDVKLAFNVAPGLTDNNFVDLWGYTDAANNSWNQQRQPPAPYGLYVGQGGPTTPQNTSFGPQYVPPSGGPRVFDTWSSYYDGTYNYTGWNPLQPGQQPGSTTIPLSFNPKAIQIIIRIWDDKTESARQITIVQEM